MKFCCVVWEELGWQETGLTDGPTDGQVKKIIPSTTRCVGYHKIKIWGHCSFKLTICHRKKHAILLSYIFWELIRETRGSKEPVSLTLVYVTIKQRKQMDSWQNCILVMVMSLYILLYWTSLLLTIISIYNKLGPVVSVENVSKNLQIL